LHPIYWFDTVTGVLDVAILGLLVDGDHHGYELKKRLTELLGPWSSVSFGSLYPALSRLERDGYVATVDAGAAAAPDDGVPAPMSGSLGAELAAFRRDRSNKPARPSGRRARKVYTITDIGRRRLAELLTDPSGDERSFAVRVAFCGHLGHDERLSLFRERRVIVTAKTGTATTGGDHPDRYRRSLLEFQRDRHLRELAWLDQLIEAGERDADRPEDPPVLTPHGGNES
jgi:DNA-binding PadR family transcriptional regulator